MKIKVIYAVIASVALSLATAMPTWASTPTEPAGDSNPRVSLKSPQRKANPPQRKASVLNYKKKADLKNWPRQKKSTGSTATPFLPSQERMPGKLVPAWGSRNQTARPMLQEGGSPVYTFEGALLYSDNWEEYYHPYGVATFEGENPATFKQVFENDELPQTGGGFFTDKYYFMTAYSEDMWSGELAVTTYVYEKTKWEEVFEMVQDINALATDLSYDAIDDVAYGCFYSETGNGVDWGYMNVHDLSVSHIAPLAGELVAVAVNSRGVAYAITNSGYFVKVDKKTGQITSMGATGLTPAYLQTATFSDDGTFYWAASLNDDSSGLYTVDLSTGRATLVAPFPNNEEVVALYARHDTPSDGTPAAISNLSLNFADDDLSGLVEFTVPANTVDGKALIGTVNYVVTVDGEDLASGTTAAGEHVQAAVSVAHAGYHYFSVTLSNDAGNGDSASLRQWVGIDEPKPVANVVVAKTGDREATITWDSPGESVHGGYFSADRLSYTITRLPDGKVVATGLKDNTYIDDVDISGQALVRYSVSAYADDVEGQTVTSNGIIFGDAFEVPVLFSFDTEEDFNIFTVIDNNETPSLDSGCWLYSPSGQVAGYNTGTKDGDDWLITPGIALKADRQYTFQYDVLCYSDYWPDEYSVYMGNAATEEGMTTQLLPKTTIYWDEFRTMTFTVTVPADGIYYFGFYATSEAGGAFFLIDDIRVTEGYVLQAPAAVTDLTVTASENGEATATVSFIAPEQTVGGKMLSSLSSIDIMRGGETVKTFDFPEPGERLTFTETDLATGMTSYEVVAKNTQGTSPAATAEAWVGTDYPSAPQHVKVALNVDGHPVITWEQPNGRGVYGGYVDNAHVTYTVYKTTTGQWLKQEINGYSYVDESVTTGNCGDQTLLEYAVFAESEKGLGYPSTAFYIDGANYEMPFVESFAGTKPSHFWGFYGTNGESWVIGDDWSYYSQDEDDGLLAYLPATPGSEVTAFSGKIAIKGAQNAVLSFYLNKMTYENNGFYETNPDDDELYVQVAADGFDLRTVQAIHMKDINKSGYQLYQVPLAQFADNEFIVIAFTQHAASDQTPVMLDNIRIENLLSTNLTIAEVSSPESVEVNETAGIHVTVKNSGLTDVTDYAIELYRGEVLEQSMTGLELTSGSTSTETFELEVQPSWKKTETFTVKVICEADEDLTDNVSEPFTIDIVRPDMPAATDLSVAETDNGAVFTWNAPAGLEPQSEMVTDDFESYKHGDRTYGEWTCKDAAPFGEYGVIDIADASGEYIDIPHFDEWQAFMVFSPSSAFIDIDSEPRWTPHSGKKMLISLCDYANSFGSSYRNNDWLISPQLDGSAQTITFYARTASAAERKDFLEVRYSTSDNEIASFQLVGNGNIQLQTEWTRYEFTLPEGTLYFALRNNTDGGTGVMVDDITYCRGIAAAELTLLGYNLYCDGELVNSELITETSYTVESPIAGGYTVTAVYTIGESEPSNAVTIGATTGISLFANGNLQDGAYYDLQGRRALKPTEGWIYLRQGRKTIYKK